MKKLWITILVGFLVLPMIFQSPAQADTPIRIFIDGAPLSTDQAPVMVKGRTMVPLRAIFEAFDATIKWNQKTQTVTATKEGTTIVLKIGSKLATVNNKSVSLDVPGQNLKGRTMVPTRFVSEALGQKVGWDSKTKVVSITTSGGSAGSVSPVSYVGVKDVDDLGDGRDLQVSFVQSVNKSLVDHYRVLIVKAGKTLDLSSAQKISSSNYFTVLNTGTDPTVTLTAASRDVDGALIGNNQAYAAYVLAVGKGSNTSALSNVSSTITLVNNNVIVPSNVQVRDVSDYSDGRDLSVSFNKVSDESKISSYRIFVVKAANYTSFNLEKANAVTSSNYTQVSKTGSNITQVLSSGARDVDGVSVKAGVSYRVFVMALNNGGNAGNNALSSASSAITLSATGISNLNVSDISDYGDGRDLNVSFTHATDETYISQYRILIVPTASYSNFSLTEANNVSSSYVMTVTTTGTSTSQALSSTSKDIRGNLIKNGTSYKVYVLSIGSGTNTGTNVLSSASSAITLSGNSIVSAVSNLYASDVNDYGDGRDLNVSFTHAADETYISQYRVLVIPTAYYSSLSLSEAENMSSSYYTTVSTTGSSTNQILNSTAKDVRGNLIRNGTSYKVYVLSVGGGVNSGTNTLSYASSAIMLSDGSTVSAISNLSVSDVNDYGDGRDLKVSFTHATDERYVSQYRILVVPTASYSSFSLSDANNVSGSNYTMVSTTDSSTSLALATTAKDVSGNLIKNGTSYKVYVLSIGSGIKSGTNVLSSASSVIMLSGGSLVSAISNLSVSDVNDYGDGRDLSVSFTHATDEANISQYRIMVVPTASYSSFSLADANNVSSANYTEVNTGGSSTHQALADTAKDVSGNLIKNGTSYKIYVLSVGKETYTGTNVLSAESSIITLSSKTPVISVTNVTYTLIDSAIQVSFNKSTLETNISEYRVLVVPSKQGFGSGDALGVTSSNYSSITPNGTNPSVVAATRDVNGALLVKGVKYKVYVLAVANSNGIQNGGLSDSTEEFEI